MDRNSGTENIDLAAILERLNKLERENVEIKAELKTISHFISAMTESQSIDELMTEVESAAKQLTDSDKVTFYCMDNISNKFFSEDEGREWQTAEAAEEIKSVFDSQEISQIGSKTLIPLVTGDGKSLGVLEAEKQSGLDTEALSWNFAKGGTFVENIKLGLKKEYEHQGRITDELTEMYNRQGLNEFMRNTVVKALNKGQSVNLLMSDIDHFKKVNDTYGHPAGDAILKAVANAFKEFTKDGPSNCFRIGGEEMAAILITNTPEEAIEMAEELRRVIERTVTDVIDKNNQPQSIKVTISVGIHEMNPQEAVTPENARAVFGAEIKTADTALYEAKEAGRNKVISADEHTYMSYLASKAIDVFVEAEGITDKDMVNDVTEMILDSFVCPTEEENLKTLTEALRAYADQSSGELADNADFIADKIEEFEGKLNPPVTREHIELSTEEVIPENLKPIPAVTKEHTELSTEEVTPENLKSEETEKKPEQPALPTLRETLDKIVGWADKVHLTVMEKNKAKDWQEHKKDGEAR